MPKETLKQFMEADEKKHQKKQLENAIEWLKINNYNKDLIYAYEKELIKL